MSAKPWILALGLGALVAGGAWLLDQRGPDGSGGAQPTADWNETGFVFLGGGRAPAGRDVTLLQVGFVPAPTWLALDCDVDAAVVAYWEGAVDCYVAAADDDGQREAPGLLGNGALHEAHVRAGTCDCRGAPWSVEASSPQEPHLGNGTWAANVTLFAFRSDGFLAASNAEAADVARFEPDGDYIQLPQGTWFLGTGPAPDGTAELPRWVRDLARPLVEGLPVGGIATARVDDHPYAWAVGTLWVTVRVEAVATPS